MATLSSQELELRAERAVRHGEMLAALDYYEVLLAERPGDEGLRARVEAVRDSLQPSELAGHRHAEMVGDDDVSAQPMTPAEQGELAASSGRFAEAVDWYQRAVAENPTNELLRERLTELLRYAPPPSRAVDDGLAEAERLEQVELAQVSGRAPKPERSARAAAATFLPLDSPTPSGKIRGVTSGPAPGAPEPTAGIDFLRELLERVARSSRRG
jgi:hypothetical protein